MQPPQRRGPAIAAAQLVMPQLHAPKLRQERRAR
jgi:hypothetical protein